jgi:hypothetical protein
MRNRYKRYWSYVSQCNHRRGAAGGKLVSGASRSSGQWTVAGKDDREPSGHHTCEGIGSKHGEPDGRRSASQLRSIGQLLHTWDFITGQDVVT